MVRLEFDSILSLVTNIEFPLRFALRSTKVILDSLDSLDSLSSFSEQEKMVKQISRERIMSKYLIGFLIG